jgi:TRAP-type C4-dicarboxylate transport system permease small subunit
MDYHMKESGLHLPPSWPSANFISEVGKGFNAFLDGVTLSLFALLLILAVTQVVFRYVLMIPLPWTEELARFTLVWVTFFGAASVTRRKLHLAVDILISKLASGKARVLSIFFNLLILIFLGTALWGAIIMMEEAMPIFAGSIPWLSQMFLYLGAVIGLSLMVLYVLAQLCRDLYGIAFSESRS